MEDLEILSTLIVKVFSLCIIFPPKRLTFLFLIIINTPIKKNNEKERNRIGSKGKLFDLLDASFFLISQFL